MNLSQVKTNVAITAALLFSTTFSSIAFSATNGVSAYLPLEQSPVLEGHVNRLLIVSEMGVVKRPIATNLIHQAYNKSCIDVSRSQPAVKRSCIEVKRYLTKTNKDLSLSHARIAARLNSQKNLIQDQREMAVSNQRGEPMDANWSLQGQGIYNVNDYLLVSAGAKVWDSKINLEDTYVSFGLPQAQVDIGYKPHWLSPFKQSAMLLSTHAPTFANISLSNNTPMTSWNINYELFAGELSSTDRIRFEGEYTTGTPLITGLHLSVSPIPGFTLAVNRILQSGGDERGTPSLKELLEAFIDPSGSDNTSDDLGFDEQFGNQAASIVSRFDFVGNIPFSIYLEYAGEDTSRGTNYRLGNSSLSAGIDIPFIYNRLSFNYEYSQWQNAWYSHSVYQDGLQNENRLIGHFAAEQRRRTLTVSGEAIGATHHNATLGWQLSPNNRLEIKVHLTKNEPLAAYDYDIGRNVQLDFFTEVDSYPIQFSLYSGQNTLSEEHAGITLQVGWK